MSKWRRIFMVAGLLLAVAVIWFLFQGVTEPRYQGKRLSQWIANLEYENLNPTDEQRVALRAMGEPAVRNLIGLLEKRDSPLKQKFVAYARRHADVYNRFVAPHYVIPENTYHAQAATALGEIGPAARAAIPALQAASTNHYYLVALRAQAALMLIQQDPVESLVRRLDDTQATNWYEVATTLKYLGTNGAPGVPGLVMALGDTNADVRDEAAEALGGIVSRPEIAVPALLAHLHDGSAEVRRSAVDSLCKFKEAKQQIIGELLPLVQDGDLNVWLGAAFGLEGLLTKEERKTILAPALIKALNSRDGTIRANAELFLKRDDPEAAAKLGIK